ncbi:MAG TPA: hypothetical protein VGH66_13620 [Acidimicrobiales bacterium]|jgi:hypothetical protein
MTSKSQRHQGHSDEGRSEVLREAATMMLYVSVVEMAELVSLPEGHFPDGRITGPVGAALLAIIWGTAVGLALAHWFAFRVAAPAFRGESPTIHDNEIGLAQLGGAVTVAAVSSLPVLFLSDAHAQDTVPGMPAVIIGIISYLVARASGRERFRSACYGVTALLLGVVVAFAKSRLAAH